MDTLELLSKNEEEISELYGLYAKILPHYKDFWLELMNEEIGHASWIRDFANGIEKRALFINPQRFPMEAFNTYKEYLHGAIDRASRKGIDPIQAFTSALYVEQSLIELPFFAVIDTGSEDFDKVVLRLREATEWHIKKIEEYWSNVKDKMT